MCVKTASSQDALAVDAWVRSEGSWTFPAPLPASSVYKPSTRNQGHQVFIFLRPGPSLPILALHKNSAAPNVHLLTLLLSVRESNVLKIVSGFLHSVQLSPYPFPRLPVSHTPGLLFAGG